MLNSQHGKLKSGTKTGKFNVSSNAVVEPNDETNFPIKLLLTNTQVSRIHKPLANGSSANIKFWKTQLSKMK